MQLLECKPFVRDLETMAITTDMLAAFVQVAEQLSVSAAAADLGVGKSVVSKRIAQLEAAVAATLFSRSTRRVALTPAGEAYLGFARRALGEVAGAQERLRDLRSELSGQIRLTAPVSWGQRVLARALPEFLRLHPGIELELLLADRMMDIAHERIDIALRWTSAPAADLSAQPLAEVAWVVAAAPAYLAGRHPPAEPEDLAGHPCMSYWRDSADDAWVLARDGQRRQVRVRGRYHANNPEAVVEAALAGLGVALLPGYLCTEALADGRLVPVLPGWMPVTKFGNRITAVAAPERLRIARNQALLGHLRQALAAG
jgi:DNA-binding transcriptional LysR family regulator